ncbi:MAG: hypothetical protein QM786_05440 [Breznakibacter sp.]
MTYPYFPMGTLPLSSFYLHLTIRYPITLLIKSHYFINSYINQAIY